jgi:hypothetical protein
VLLKPLPIFTSEKLIFFLPFPRAAAQILGHRCKVSAGSERFLLDIFNPERVKWGSYRSFKLLNFCEYSQKSLERRNVKWYADYGEELCLADKLPELE